MNASEQWLIDQAGLLDGLGDSPKHQLHDEEHGVLLDANFGAIAFGFSSLRPEW